MHSFCQPFSPNFLLLQYVYKLPESIDFDNAVALTLNYVSAHYLLFEVGHLKPNQTVFIQSCAGGVVSIDGKLHLASGVQHSESLGTAAFAKAT